MLTNGCAALYHYNDETKSWKRSFFPCASIYRRFGSNTLTATFSPNNYCIIRIPDHANADIAIGDYIYIGNPSQNEPDISACLKVTAFCRNCRGSSPHLKIICAD